MWLTKRYFKNSNVYESAVVTISILTDCYLNIPAKFILEAMTPKNAYAISRFSEITSKICVVLEQEFKTYVNREETIQKFVNKIKKRELAKTIILKKSWNFFQLFQEVISKITLQKSGTKLKITVHKLTSFALWHNAKLVNLFLDGF